MYNFHTLSIKHALSHLAAARKAVHRFVLIVIFLITGKVDQLFLFDLDVFVSTSLKWLISFADFSPLFFIILLD